MKKILLVISLIWQLPQFLLGCIFFLFYYKKASKIEIINNRIHIYCFKIVGGLGTAGFVFLKKDIETYSHIINGKKRGPAELIKHETGHTIQSLLLGPLFLPVIGLPSVLWYYIFHIFKLKEKNINFTWFYTEAWADYLGGVR